MPKSKGMGGKNRRRGKKDTDLDGKGAEMTLKAEGQEYARVERMLGNGRLWAQAFDGKRRMCHIRGKMRKKIWINQGDLVLLGLRDFQDDKADVMMKYTPEEERRLKASGELPEINMQGDNAGGDSDEDECAFEFDDL